MIRFYLIHVVIDGAGGPPEPAVIGPYMTASLQTSAAATARDTSVSASDMLLWLDINNGVPSVGAFDPMFWQEANR